MKLLPLQLVWMSDQITDTHPQTLLTLMKLFMTINSDSILGLIFYLGGDPPGFV